jgi:hypothetical protein
MNYNFIKTSDYEVAEKLRSCGYQELPRDGKLFVFINDAKTRKFDAEGKELVYTNALSV